MEKFLRAQLSQDPEVTSHLTIYIFENWAPRVEGAALSQRIDLQSKTIIQMEKICM